MCPTFHHKFTHVHTLLHCHTLSHVWVCPHMSTHIRANAHFPSVCFSRSHQTCLNSHKGLLQPFLSPPAPFIPTCLHYNESLCSQPKYPDCPCSLLVKFWNSQAPMWNQMQEPTTWCVVQAKLLSAANTSEFRALRELSPSPVEGPCLPYRCSCISPATAHSWDRDNWVTRNTLG